MIENARSYFGFCWAGGGYRQRVEMKNICSKEGIGPVYKHNRLEFTFALLLLELYSKSFTMQE